MNPKTPLLASLASVFIAAAAWAVPSQLAHQGRLLDVEGAALTGEHALTFALFDAATEGAEVWSETITVNIVGGFYSVVLGADEGANPLDDLVLSNPPLWLELTVDDGEPLLPRHELLSVPYAVLAGTATNVEGGYVDATEVAVDGTTVIDAAGNWIGPTPPMGWGDLTGIPAGLGDGVDADTLAGLSCADGGVAKFDLGSGLWACGIDSLLGSSEVLAFVDGAMLDLGIGSTVNGVTIATVADLDWSLLSSVPVGFLDGDDADSLAALSCADGGVAKFNLGTGLWACGTDSVLGSGEVLAFVGGAVIDLGAGSSMGGAALATVSDLTWGSLGGIPSGFADGFDADTMAALGLACADDDRPSWDLANSVWICVADTVLNEQEVENYIFDEPMDLPVGSTLGGQSISTGSGGLFGGTGADGALIVTSGPTTLDLGGAAYFVRNFTSIDITGSGQLNFFNPHANGTIIILRAQQNATITTSASPAIDLTGLGRSATFMSGPNPGTGAELFSDVSSTASGGYLASWFLAPLDVSRSLRLATGAGGVSGYCKNGISYQRLIPGGRGGGSLLLEVGGTLALTAEIDASAEDGDDATSGCCGGGGGGSAGRIVILFGATTGSVGTLTNRGGNGGAASSLGCTGAQNIGAGIGAGGFGGEGSSSSSGCSTYPLGNGGGGGAGGGSGGIAGTCETGGTGGASGNNIFEQNVLFP